MNFDQQLGHAPLGKSSAYPEHYDPTLLFPIPRQVGRAHLALIPPWQGEDIWRAFEVSWLNPQGKPEIAIVKFTFPCTSSHIIESKSFKLYLNSFNQEKTSWEEVYRRLVHDLSQASGASVQVERETAHTLLHAKNPSPSYSLDAFCLDDLEVSCTHYEPAPHLLCADPKRIVKESLISDLLKSNCPVTSQPDWGTVLIRYEGPAINHENLLQYIVSYRHHNGFHEQCVEQIYTDILTYCQPHALEVSARYTRRGGLDINPRRASLHLQADPRYDQSIRTPRQ